MPCAMAKISTTRPNGEGEIARAWPQNLVKPHVSVGSTAPFSPSDDHFRSTLVSGQFQSSSACLKGARSGRSSATPAISVQRGRAAAWHCDSGGWPDRIRVSAGSVKGVRLFEQLHGLRHIVAALLKGLWIPFAALGSEEVPTIDVNGAGQPVDRIGHRMNDVFTQGVGVFRG